jgi:hypothetical protein
LELANEFTTRKTLPKFYRTLGAKETPQKQFMDNRNSTGYNKRVKNYDTIIKEGKLDADKDVCIISFVLFYDTKTVKFIHITIYS